MIDFSVHQLYLERVSGTQQCLPLRRLEKSKQLDCATESGPCWNWARVANVPRGMRATTEPRVTHSMILFVCLEVLSDVGMLLSVDILRNMKH